MRIAWIVGPKRIGDADWHSVRFREPRLGDRALIAADAGASGRAAPGHVANGRLRLVLDLRFAIGRPAPGGDDEAGTSFHHLLELFVGRDPLSVLVAERAGTIEQGPLHVVEQLLDTSRQSVHGEALFLAGVAAGDEHSRLLDVLRTDFDAQRHASKLPFREFPSGTFVALIERHADAGRPQLLLNLLRFGQHRFAPVVAADGHDDDLVWRHARRQDQTAVVAVRHDDAADESRRHTPGGAPYVLH